MRRNAFTWWGMIMVLAGLAPLAVILMVRWAEWNEGERRASCQSNLTQISQGILQYVMDNDDKFPQANLEEQGWADLIRLYVKSPQLFQCPLANSGQADGTTDYFYNAQLSGLAQRKLTFSANTITLGDGMAAAPSNFSLTSLPPDWITDPHSPAYRHKNGANYAFVDGHVKWLKPEEISNDKASNSVNTFAPW